MSSESLSYSGLGTNADRPLTNLNYSQFHDLCVAVVREDVGAVAKFRRGLVPHLRRVVRRALSSRQSARALDRNLRMAAREFHAKKARHVVQPDETCVSYLAMLLCNLIIHAVRSAPRVPAEETILRVLEAGTLPDV